MKKPFYITTTLPYVNADPHIGFAMEIIAADVLARFQKNQGLEVIFNTGTDEHGQKIYQKALEANQKPLDYCDHYAQQFAKLIDLLNLSVTNFIRTTDESHQKAAQHFWNLCLKNKDIYKRKQTINYCVGCEMEKQLSELIDNRCPLHPNQQLEIREEENYFFRFSKYQQPLLNLYENQQEFVKPETKLREISAFVANGLQDFSISRLKNKMPWGIPVPNDPDHVMYVWFDALVNYISTLGWPENNTKFDQFWPGVQIAGKDNLRQQAAMWQAMLMSARLIPSQQILINGFISVDGQKMSKSLGNVIQPSKMVKRYGTDATRFLLMQIGPIGDDIDVSWEKFDVQYTYQLANAIGNTCSRVAMLCQKNNVGYKKDNSETWDFDSSDSQKTMTSLESLLSRSKIGQAIKLISTYVAHLEKQLSLEKPWKEDGEKQKQILNKAINGILTLANLLDSIMPETAKNISQHFSKTEISALTPLFPRLDN